MKYVDNVIENSATTNHLASMRTYRYAISATNGRSQSPLSQEAQVRMP
jgi:hypothetical protein